MTTHDSRHGAIGHAAHIAVAPLQRAADTPLTGAAIAEQLAAGEIRVIVSRDDVVVGERAVPGEVSVWRRIVCQLFEPGRWRVAYCIKRGRYEHDLVARRVIGDVLEFGMFVGGCFSTPLSLAEVAALKAGLRLL